MNNRGIGIGAALLAGVLMLGSACKPGETSCEDVAEHAWAIMSQSLPEEIRKDTSKMEEAKKKALPDIIAGCKKESSPEDRACVMESSTAEGVQLCISKVKAAKK